MEPEKQGDKVIPTIASAICLEALFRLQSERRGKSKSETRSIVELKRKRPELRKAEVTGICGQSIRGKEIHGKGAPEVCIHILLIRSLNAKSCMWTVKPHEPRQRMSKEL